MTTPTNQCPTCGGSGYTPANFEMGIQSMLCSLCHGTGKVANSQPLAPDTGYTVPADNYTVPPTPESFEEALDRYLSFSGHVVEPFRSKIIAAHRQALADQLQAMLEAERDNKAAGHKWSSGDWRKYVEYELTELGKAETKE